MEFAVQVARERLVTTAAVHRCPQCREQALVLHRRHVSPPRLGASQVTEYWTCDCCDASYQFSPAADRWRPLSS